MFCMTSLRDRTNNIVNVIDWIGNAGVKGQAGIAEIDFAISIHHHIFQQRIAADCPIDFWLAGLAQITCLGVTTTFKIENAIIIPAMFIITNQAAV